MSQFFAWVLLFLMIAPATLSVLFASRSWFAILWNFGWYMLLADVGEVAFQSHQGQFIGVFFATLYAVRLIFAPKVSTNRFVFKMGNMRNGNYQPREQSQPSGTVIDAEYTVSDSHTDSHTEKPGLNP